MRLEFLPVILTLLFISVGIFLVWLAKQRKAEFTGAEWAAVFIPTIAYLIFSGTLSEFSAGGFAVKLLSKVQAAVPASIIQARYIVGGEAPSANLGPETLIGRGQRVIAIRADTWDGLTEPQRESRAVVVARSIYQSIMAGGFEGLVVLDARQRPIGIFEPSRFFDLLRIPLDRLLVPAPHRPHVLSEEQINARVLETDLWAILKAPQKRAELESNTKAVVRFDISKIDAAKTMIENRFDALIVVDAAGRYMGVLPKRLVLDQIFLDLIEATKPR